MIYLADIPDIGYDQMSEIDDLIDEAGKVTY